MGIEYMLDFRVMMHKLRLFSLAFSPQLNTDQEYQT